MKEDIPPKAHEAFVSLKRRAAPAHVSILAEWARRKGVLNIALALLRLIPDHSDSAMLGGLLRFIGYRETLNLLNSWAPEDRLIRQLAQLSEQLVDFPAIDVPQTSLPIHKQFSKLLGVNYLAAQFSTRRAPGMTASQQLQVTCLRTWLLLKALKFHQVENCPDRSLQHLSTQLRMGLDDRDDGRKLSWFLSAVTPALTLHGFEQTLQLNLGGHKATSDNTSTIAENIRSFQSLLDNHRRPESKQLVHQDWSSEFHVPYDGNTTRSHETESEGFVLEAEGTIYFPANDDSEELRYQTVDVLEDATPEQVIRESRGIAFQSIEDQQYLPFSWNRLRADEVTGLKNLVQEKLSSLILADQLLAAITCLAMVTRRSLETVESLSLAVSVGEEWQLDIPGGRLHRLPSRRAVRWRAEEITQNWIRPLSKVWDIHLQPALVNALQSAAQKQPDAQCIGHLWRGQKDSLITAFNRWCGSHEHTARISSGLLVRHAEQMAFEETLDPMFARLVTSPLRAGIPGAGAYPSWTEADVANALNQVNAPFLTMSTADATLNSLGSELDPDDQLLSAAMSQARETLNATLANGEHWAVYHNRLVAYGVLMLLAVTGARPVTSVFESIKQMDLALGHIYLEDKVARENESGSSGRLVPLVPSVIDFLTRIYLPYLRHFADSIRGALPEFSKEVDKQVNGQGSDVLPLFFLVTKQPAFDWREVNESSMRSLDLFNWPLPLNLFRHRMASRLRTLGLDTEIIDAQLGHAEAGSETFGDISPRCWAEEAPAWRHALTQAFDQLAIQCPVPVYPTIQLQDLGNGYHPFSEGSVFGRKARAEARTKNREHASQKALKEIQIFVGTRPLDSIPTVEWEQLGRQMLLTEHNLRQANAAVRYQAYENFLKKEWRDNGHRPRLRKWLSQLPPPQTAFNAEVIGVTARLDRIRAALVAVHQGLVAPVPKRLAAIVSALDLCLIGKVTSKDVILALAHADVDRVRLVLFEQQAHVEYCEILTKVESPPVQRYALPARSARLADRGLSTGKRLDKTSTLPTELDGIARLAGCLSNEPPTVDELLTGLAFQVSQENTRDLPGVVSAVLAGRLISYALPWEDWIRARSGQARSEKPQPKFDDAEDSSSPIQVTPQRPIGSVSRSNRENGKVVNRKFLTGIRQTLNSYLNRRTTSGDASEEQHIRHRRTNTDSSARRDARGAIEKILHKAAPEVSVAVHALGAWALHLLSRPYRKNLLDAASIKRYLDALAHGFLTFGYEVDLADLDGEELTEFYRSLVEDGAEIPSPNVDEISPTHDTKLGGNKKYVLQRLTEFHQFAQSRYGLESVDWSEVGDGLLGSMAHPGTITEAEYKHALMCLCPHPTNASALQMRDAMILVLAFRFGLRGGEAIGLRRDDWVDVAGSIVVIISRRHRQLKTRSSQRQVPLLETLTEHENLIIQKWFEHWVTETGNNLSTPLFFDDADHLKTADMGPIRHRLIAALRVATCNCNTTLHHARHAFANRMAQHLLVRSHTGLWPAHQLSGQQLTENIQRTTLASTRTTRRSSWAIARLLGHAKPNTTFGSYLHLHIDWAIHCVRSHAPEYFPAVERKKWEVAVNLDAWPKSDDYLQPIEGPLTLPTSPQFRPCLPSSVLRFCRLRAQGMPSRPAAEHCRLATADANRIDAALILAGRKLSPNSGPTDVSVASLSLAHVLLGRIHKSRWRILIDFLEEREKSAPKQGWKFSSTTLGQQVGPTRQLLLWSQVHFEELRQVLDWLEFQNDHVSLYRPGRLDPRIESWAHLNGFTDIQIGRAQNGRKLFQVDVAREFYTDAPATVYPDRIAVVPSHTNPIVNDSYEFLLLFLAVGIGQSAE